MPRITLWLDEPTAEQLAADAKNERRAPREQAVVLIESALKQRAADVNADRN